MVLDTCAATWAITSFRRSATVLIEDDVELAAYTWRRSRRAGRTRIGRGTKLDNLVHVGHNCDIASGWSSRRRRESPGSVIIEDDCVIGGQEGFASHSRPKRRGDWLKGGRAAGKIVRPGVWWGIPIQPLADYKRLMRTSGACRTCAMSLRNCVSV